MEGRCDINTILLIMNAPLVLTLRVDLLRFNVRNGDVPVKVSVIAFTSIINILL